MVKIIKGLPLPYEEKLPQYGYPWKNMEVGDAFPMHERHNHHAFKTVAYTMSKHYGRKYVVRQTDSGQWMCWRIK